MIHTTAPVRATHVSHTSSTAQAHEVKIKHERDKNARDTQADRLGTTYPAPPFGAAYPAPPFGNTYSFPSFGRVYSFPVFGQTYPTEPFRVTYPSPAPPTRVDPTSSPQPE